MRSSSTSGSPPQVSSPRGGWGRLLASSTPERRATLQSVLDEWRPGRWTLSEGELGRGSSGAVFQSSDSRLGHVAIKFTHGHEQNKLEREAALMQRVAHQHICKLYEHHVSADGQLFAMVLELLQNGSLAQRIKESPNGRFREFEAVQITFDVLDGLAHMHGKDVIHRDVKPSNIMLTEVDGRFICKLIDLSISAVEMSARDDVSQTLRTGTTSLGALAGTPHYMSPEQMQEGMVVTSQTDLWSLTVVLFELLSGTLPFAPGEVDLVKIAVAILTSPAKDLPDVLDEVDAVSEGMAEFVSRALRKEPTQRFGSAREMAAALDAVINLPGDSDFGLFISYRVWCDKDFAEALFRAASKCQLRPGREHRMKVYLDKVRIVDGQRFDENFIKGLANSTVFTPLLSANCLQSFVELGVQDKEDFVLMEWLVAIELNKRDIVKSIFPITIEMQDEGKKDGAKDGKAGLYSESFFMQLRDGKVNGKPLPDLVSAKSVAKAREFLRMLNPPVELSEELSVKAVVEKILTFQAILLHFENDALDGLEAVKLARVGSTHGKRAKEIAQKHVAQTCAERIAKTVRTHRSHLEPQPEPQPEPESVSSFKADSPNKRQWNSISAAGRRTVGSDRDVASIRDIASLRYDSASEVQSHIFESDSGIAPPDLETALLGPAQDKKTRPRVDCCRKRRERRCALAFGLILAVLAVFTWLCEHRGGSLLNFCESTSMPTPVPPPMQPAPTPPRSAPPPPRHCASGWSGSDCGDPTGCDSNPCTGPGSTCTASGGSHTCSCVSACQNNGVCDDQTGHCRCPSGFSGDGCQTAATCPADPPTPGAPACALGAYGMSGANPSKASQCPVITCTEGYRLNNPGKPWTCGSNGKWQGDDSATCSDACAAHPCGPLEQCTDGVCKCGCRWEAASGLAWSGASTSGVSSGERPCQEACCEAGNDCVAYTYAPQSGDGETGQCRLWKDGDWSPGSPAAGAREGKKASAVHLVDLNMCECFPGWGPPNRCDTYSH